jgi:lysozyme
MQLGTNGEILVKGFESCLKPVGKGTFQAYLDPVGVWTIGWGHTNHHEPKFTPQAVWTQAQCDAVFLKDMRIFEIHVARNAKVALTQNQFDALVSWAYNTGGPANSQVWVEVNAGRHHNVPERLSRWNKGGGRVLAGLVRRRKAEGQLYAGDVAGAMRTTLQGGKAPPVSGRETPKPTAPELAARTKREAGTGAAGGAVAGGSATQDTKSADALVGQAVLIGFGLVVAAIGIFLLVRKVRQLKSAWA